MMNGIYSRFSEASAGLATTRTELGNRIDTLGRDLRGEMADLRAELNGRIDGLRAEVNGRIDSLGAELHRDHAGLVDGRGPPGAGGAGPVGA